MKIRLAVGKEKYAEIKAVLLEHGIEVAEDAEFVLSESNRYVD